MCAIGDDAAFIDDDDAVGGDDGAEPMRDQKAGSTFHDFLQRIVDLEFAVGIDLAHRLVED